MNLETRIFHIFRWARQKNAEHPDFFTRVKHSVKQTAHTYTKAHVAGPEVVKALASYIPVAGASAAVSFVADKVIATKTEAHHLQRAREARYAFADDPCIDKHDDLMKFEIKCLLKQLDQPRLKVHKARLTMEALRTMPAQKSPCIHAKDLVRAVDYYRKRVRVMRYHADTLTTALTEITKWVEANEKLLEDFAGKPGAVSLTPTKLQKLVGVLTDHPHTFCDSRKCINLADEDTREAIIDARTKPKPKVNVFDYFFRRPGHDPERTPLLAGD